MGIFQVLGILIKEGLLPTVKTTSKTDKVTLDVVIVTTLLLVCCAGMVKTPKEENNLLYSLTTVAEKEFV